MNGSKLPKVMLKSLNSAWKWPSVLLSPWKIDLDDESTWLLYIADLIIKQVKGTISKDEKKALEKWAASSERNKKLLDKLPQTND